MASLAPDVAALLAEHSFLSINERGKVHCSLTGHDMPPRADAIRAHLAGKQLAKARDWYIPANDSLHKYGPWIVAHKSNNKKAFCRLTSTTLNRIPEEIEAHMAGRRFKHWLAEAEKGGVVPGATGKAPEGAEDDGDDDGDEEDEEDEDDEEEEEEDGDHVGGKPRGKFVSGGAVSDSDFDDPDDDDEGAATMAVPVAPAPQPAKQSGAKAGDKRRRAAPPEAAEEAAAAGSELAHSVPPAVARKKGRAAAPVTLLQPAPMLVKSSKAGSKAAAAGGAAGGRTPAGAGHSARR